MTPEEKRAWLVNLFVAVLDRISLDEIGEEAGDSLTGYVESLTDEDAEEVYDEAMEVLS